ncbi:hypothetical protein Nepgr_002618 [Nepenthes gracilis]|uniref:Holocarboxylase synthetase n=1 Tax=Nepenthes gracilis TaxID=150966 RepID=A0AAD3P6M0_NEPGR|nr:hypothetical protein Nepgr_002618 [Nepenthes gracilis]
MGKKRKSIATSLDEVDRTMYAAFCSAANSLSQLYTQSMNHQKLSFQSGERHGFEKLYQWIIRKQEAGSRVTTIDILTYLQNELEYCGGEPSVSLRAPLQNQHSHPLMHFSNLGLLVSSGSSGQTTAAQGVRSEHLDNQSRNSVFLNALRSLQHCHLTQGGYYPNGKTPAGNGGRNNETNSLHDQSRDSNPLSSNNSSMDE